MTPYGTPNHCNFPPPYTYDDDTVCPACDDEFYCRDHQDPDDGPIPLDRVHEVAVMVCLYSAHYFRPGKKPILKGVLLLEIDKLAHARAAVDDAAGSPPNATS